TGDGLLGERGENWRPWQWIVVHHTAAEHASLEGIDRYHRVHFGDPLGAEYHFVINNGRRRALGLIEPARWRYQELAAHLFHPERAPESLALCLIGNFEERPVPASMMDALALLCRRLMGTLEIPIERVTTHRAVDGRLTQCPGRHFDLDDLRARIVGRVDE
ncbi:MAG: N-acetylmuramoyl-L-alanine amidase, partial [Myxococcales bacterium]|nr:N-acetylmuramoyl-L-alanine amidase [Myxococcales bacterium]